MKYRIVPNGHNYEVEIARPNTNWQWLKLPVRFYDFKSASTWVSLAKNVNGRLVTK